jgi:hypothetical protein
MFPSRKVSSCSICDLVEVSISATDLSRVLSSASRNQKRRLRPQDKMLRKRVTASLSWLNGVAGSVGRGIVLVRCIAFLIPITFIALPPTLIPVYPQQWSLLAVDAHKMTKQPFDADHCSASIHLCQSSQITGKMNHPWHRNIISPHKCHGRNCSPRPLGFSNGPSITGRVQPWVRFRYQSSAVNEKISVAGL